LSPDWRDDYDAALVEAGRQDRLVLVQFTRDDRPVCKAMARDTLAHPDVMQICRNSFLCVRVDSSRQADLFQRLTGASGALAACVVDGTGEAAAVLPGYAGPQAYVRFLERAREGYPRLREARAAWKAVPDDPRKTFDLAEAYRRLEHHVRAEELYLQVTEAGDSALGPDGALRDLAALAHERLARIRVIRGRSLDARGHLASFRRLDPGDRLGRADAVRLTEALACANEMKFDEAARLLARVPTEAAAEDADRALFTAGVIGHETGDYAAALKTLERMVREHPRSPLRDRAEERIEHIRNPPPGHSH
jgi:tetratricopeptide (TPR) repeat protein